jgi:hypothetical protein
MDLGIRSHRVQESHALDHSGSLDFHQVVANLVLKAVGIMCQARRAFKVFDDLDQYLAQFIEPRVFHMCDQFLVPWLCSIEPKLA